MSLFSSLQSHRTSLAISWVFGVLLLSACEAQLQDLIEAANSEPASEPTLEKTVEKDTPKEVMPASHVETAPKTPEEPPKIIILQDGVDAFLGYKHIEIPEDLNGTYSDLNKGILAFILAFNLRDIANADGVSSWAKIRTSSAGETTWQYELSSLPDDAIYATEYKVYFEKIGANYRIAKIGHRQKCYRGDNPKQWAVELCP